jgi:hypothetical protein
VLCYRGRAGKYIYGRGWQPGPGET